jgi:NO-binding membrane sensor protein with MHYT domain
MGGVAIWSMHYIGNRAIILYGDQKGLQLSYAAGFTVLSFFMPVLVLLLSYAIIGGVENPPIWRLLVGGTFGGAAICGMHYLVPDG